MTQKYNMVYVNVDVCNISSSHYVSFAFTSWLTGPFDLKVKIVYDSPMGWVSFGLWLFYRIIFDP